MKTALAMVVAVAALILVACVDRKTDSPITPPGQAESVKTKTLEAGAAILQNKPPIEAINAYLDGFHFYNGRDPNTARAERASVKREVEQALTKSALRVMHPRWEAAPGPLNVGSNDRQRYSTGDSARDPVGNRQFVLRR